MKHKYILGVEFTKCPKENPNLCIFKRLKKCKDSITDCGFPIYANPLCTCKVYRECQGKFSIRKKDGRIFVLYLCNRGTGCKFFIKSHKEFFSKFPELLDNKNLYYGSRLDKLVEYLEEGGTKNSYDELVTLLETVILSLDTGSV